MTSVHEMRPKYSITSNIQLPAKFNYQKWLSQLSCNIHGTPSPKRWNRISSDSVIVDFMFSKKIKLLICRTIHDIFLITEDGEEYDWTQAKNRRDAEVYKWKCKDKYEHEEDKLLLYRFSEKFDLSNIRFVKTAIGSATFCLKTGPKDYQFLGTTDIGKMFYGLKEGVVNEKITYIACARFYYMIVTDHCKVYRFEKNCKQLVIKTSTDGENDPHKVFELKGNKIVKVVCKRFQYFIFTDKATVYIGDIEFGISSNAKEDIYATFQVPTTSKILDIAATEILTVIATEDGLVYVHLSFVPGQFVNIVCENTNLLDVSNAMTTSSSIFMDRVYSDEESNILDVLKTAFNDCYTSDLTIKVEEQPIYVHKALLRIRSLYFRCMFRYNWHENQQIVIEHDCYSYTVYKAFLNYLYTGYIINLSLENELLLLKLADEYCEENLKKYSICMIKKKITICNVLFIFDRVMQYNLMELEEYCVKFFLKNVLDVRNTEHWKCNFDEEMKNILIEKANDVIRSMEEMAKPT